MNSGNDCAELTIELLANVIGAEPPEGIDGSKRIGRVLTQSVYTKPGDAIISAGWYPRKQIVTEALDKGAAVVFCDFETKQGFPDNRVVGVQNPMDCVYLFEEWRAKNCPAIRIAISGSVGKTTTTGLINSIISNTFETLTHHTMSNSHGAILRNVQKLDASHKYWVQEVGGVQPGYIESSARFLRPNIIVLTNIGESHLNLYKTKEGILKDKGSLVKYSQPDATVVISYDDELLMSTDFGRKVVTCSITDPRADYYSEDICTEIDGVHFTTVCEDGRFPIHLNLYGDYNVYNALYAIAVGRLAGVGFDKIALQLEAYRPSGMRQNLVRVGGYTFLVDSFNAEPKTVLGSAETLSKIPVGIGGRRIFITGHIDKLGEDSAQLHRELGHELAKLDNDIVVMFAGDSKYEYESLLEDGFRNALFFDKREELDEWMRQNITRSDVVFFKSGQFEAALAKSIDHVFGTAFQNEQQFNEGSIVKFEGYSLKLRQDNIAEVVGYSGKKTNLVIPQMHDDYTITRIAARAFAESREIVSVVVPDTITNIGREAFFICPKLASVALPYHLKIIGDNAFNYCRQLRTVTIPHGTIHIGRHAFYDCNLLETVEIPDTVGFMGADVFGSDSPSVKGNRLTIRCVRGSCAEKYALDNGHKVEYL